MIEKLAPVTIAVMGIFVLVSSGIAGCDTPRDGRISGQIYDRYLTSEEYLTKSEMMKAEINKAFEQQAQVINYIGEYIEAAQKKGLMPKPEDVLPKPEAKKDVKK